MKKKREDGIIVDNSVLIIDDRKLGFSIQSRIIQFMAVLIGSWGSFSVLLESLEAPVYPGSMNLAILVLTGIMFALCLYPKYDLVKIFFTFLLYGLFLFSRLASLQNGFYIMENLVLRRLRTYYGFGGGDFSANYSTASADTTLLLIMIMTPLIAIFTIAVIRSRFTASAVILLFLPILACFLFGLIPSELYLIAYTVSVIYLSKSSYSVRNNNEYEQNLLIHRINSRAAVWLSVICLILFFVLKLFVTEKEYKEFTVINTMKSEIQSALFNFSFDDLTKKITDFWLFAQDGAAGGLNGGKLGRVDKVAFDNSEQLIITVPLEGLSNGVYLKGYVGSVYTGNSWVGHSKETEEEFETYLEEVPEAVYPVLNQVGIQMRLDLQNSRTSSVSNAKSYHMRIEYKTANKRFLYVPYFPDYLDMHNIIYEQDLYAVQDNWKDSYSVPYYYVETEFNQMDNGEVGYEKASVENNNAEAVFVIDYFSSKEKKYRDFVYKNYTELPKYGVEQLIEEFSPMKFDEELKNTYNKVTYVQNYLAEHAGYSLEPGKLPRGKDFVEYFLYENHKGYCAHFASAATLMLRAMGVPARYVEGYAVGYGNVTQNSHKKNEAIYYQDGVKLQMYEVSVKDYNAHAWIEVYIDDYGWIPVEVTPGSNVNTSYLGRFREDENNSIAATPTPKPPTPTPTIEEKEEEMNTNTTQASSSFKFNFKFLKGLPKVFPVLMLLLLILGAVFWILRIINHIRFKSTNNINTKAILLYARIEKILAVSLGFSKMSAGLEDREEYVKENCSYINQQDFTICMDIVRKARFGRGMITSEEFGNMERFHNRLHEKVLEEVSLAKKVYIKFILAMGFF